MATLRYDVDVDTARAERRIGAFALQMRQSISQAVRSLPDIEINADSTDAQRELARVRAELVALGNQRIGVDIDAGAAQAKLAELNADLVRLGASSADVQVQADVAAATAALAVVSGEVDALDGREAKVKVDVDKGAVDRIASLGVSLLKVSTAAGLAAAGLASTSGTVAGLVSVVASASGVIGLLPGALVAGGVAAVTLKVGLKGVSDALKETDPAKFAEALKGLSPAARQFATAVRDISPAWKSVQLDVQQKLFVGLGAEMQKLSSAYLPSMRSGLGGVATQFNLLGKDLVGFATSSKTIGDVDTIFRNTTKAIEAARPAAVNLTAAFMDIAVVGTGMLPQLANGFTNVTERFRVFIAQARESGQLQQWIQTGLDTLQKLGSVAGNVGSILGSVFTAAKTSGADFLTTLDRVTEGVAKFMKSGEGQNAMVAFFAESRAAIDALLPGLATLGIAAAKAIQAFSATGGLQAVGAAFSDIAAKVAPLIPQLGELAGNTLNALAAGASAAAAALTPIVTAVAAVVSALGPVAPTVLAMIVAFKGISVAAAAVVAMGVAMRAGATQAGVYALAMTGSATVGQGVATATTRMGTAFSAVGKALPLIGVAIVGLSAVYAEFGSKAGEVASKVVSGSLTMQQAIAAEVAQVEKNQIFWFSATQQQEAHAAAAGRVTEEYRRQYDALGPMAKLQADVTMAQTELNNKVVEFGPNSEQARAAAARLGEAQRALAQAEGDVTKLTQDHTAAINAQADAMSGQIGTALAYEEAVRRTGEAHKAAADALKANGANSNEYKAAVLDLARAMLSQADAARAQGEASGIAGAGAKAFGTEILRAADTSTQVGRDAFIKLASAMDTAGLSALSSTAQMSGLKTEIITLPDGRKVTVVVASERSQLDTVVADLNAVAASKYVGTVTINGDPTPFKDQFFQSVTLTNGTTAMLKLDADRAPISATIDGVVYQINATTGVMKIQGDPAPGKANLDGLKLTVDQTTGVMKIDGDPGPATAKTQTAVTFANGSTGTITIDGNQTNANGKTSAAVTFADGSRGTITIDGNQTPANGKINATVQYANGQTATIQVAANTAAAWNSINILANAKYVAYVDVVTRGGGTAGVGGGVRMGADGMYLKPMAQGGVVGFAGGGHATKFSPMRSGLAEVVKPNTWRVIGDRMKGDESYIPINGSTRSQKILRLTAQRMGWDLVPAGAAQSGGAASQGGAYARLLSALPGGTQGQATGQVAAALSVAGVEKRLDQLVQLIERRGAGASITVNDVSGDPSETARSAMLALRLS